MVSRPLLALCVLALALLLQFLVLRFATSHRLLAEVNARSSHKEPTPTLGGLVIWLVTTLYLLYLGLVVSSVSPGFAVACGLVGFTGLWDDLRPLSARVRLVVQAVAAVMLIWALDVNLPIIIAGLAVFAVVWLTNLYNFMDGIDGLAAAQVLIFCLGVELLSGGVPGWSGEVLWVLASATLAFLVFNWPPAKIFMGDVGSGFLGILIAGLALHLSLTGTLPLVASFILLAAFWFDATYTLCVRIVTGQSITQAHRSHLYQRLAAAKGHLWTTCAFLGFAFGWSLPLAWLSLRYPDWQWACLLLCLSPLAFFCRRYRAGALQPREDP